MSLMAKQTVTLKLEEIEDTPENTRIRKIAFLSASIANGKESTIKEVLRYLREKRFDRTAIYETILQSYLFLGFPRMIEAGIFHYEVFGDRPECHQGEFNAVTSSESEQWFENGVELCRKVYGKNYERLKKRFNEISPEIFRWMVIEGYGKVLTRPGLNSIERELAEVAALIVDCRERQLLSHVIGSIHVGAGIELIRAVSEDIRPLSGETAGNMAERVIEEVANKKC